LFSCYLGVRGLDPKSIDDISLKHREMVILGTQYAGEMKKGVFT
jgi:ATP-dependent phosphoenolpyruvate carboxykinase